MADEKTELDDLAFDLFSKRVAAQPNHRAIETEAIDAYKKAEVFLTVKKKVRSGGLKPSTIEESILADCCCPNQPASHPHNLVSRTMGNLEKVSRIAKFLDQNPTPAQDPEDLVIRFKGAFKDLDWKMPEINLARSLFPAYVKA